MTTSNATVEQAVPKVEDVADMVTPMPEEPVVHEITVNSGMSFDAALLEFRKSNVAAKAYARYCSELALEHFIVHGDTILLKRFYHAMTKDWNRKAAFLLWAKEFSPLTVKGSGATVVMSKDKTSLAMPPDLDKAKSIAFWEFAPEPIAELLTGGGVFKQLLKLVDKMEKQPADSEATTKLVSRLRIVLVKQMTSDVTIN